MVDDKGRKISKSEGNYIPAEKMTTSMVPTCCDFMSPAWTTPTTSASASAESRRCRKRIARSATRSATCWETSKITSDSTPRRRRPGRLHPIDRWALGQLNKVVRDVRAAYERFEFYRVHQRIYQFCAVELSSFYLDVLKDRLYAEAPAGPDRRAAQFVLARLHDHLTRLLAPIIPHTAEELWDYLPADAGKAGERSSGRVSRAEPAMGRRRRRDARWDELLKLREQILIALEGLRKSKRSAVHRKRRCVIATSRPESLATGSGAAGDALQCFGGRDRCRHRGHRRSRHGRACLLCQVRAMLELSADRRARVPSIPRCASGVCGYLRSLKVPVRVRDYSWPGMSFPISQSK